tara:strand:+ start:6598 stop:9537 length:2940 start_codon:yes stop_codon:yes gene_type:complete
MAFRQDKGVAWSFKKIIEEIKMTISRNIRRSLISTTALCASTFFLPLYAAAEDAATAEDENVFEEVVVTGSRIIRKDIESVSPITVTNAEEIKFSGHMRIEDMLNGLPQLEAAEHAYEGNGTSGVATLDLRGLGSNRTLVLVNGRRMQPGGVKSYSVDINQIPSSLLKRVEVLTGGASTTYGADAVAGVVNFIIDDTFEGVKVSAGVGAYQHNNNNSYMQGLLDDAGYDYPKGSALDGASYNFDVAMGGSFADGRGHVSMYANYRQTNELHMDSRDYSSCALLTNSCGGSSNAVIPNFDFWNVDQGTGEIDFTTERWVQMDANGAFSDFDDNYYNYAPVNHWQRPDKRFAGGGFLTYELSDNAKAYMEVMMARDTTTGQYAPSGTFFNDNYKMKCSSPLLSAAQVADICGTFGLSGDDEFAFDVGKRNVEGGPRQNQFTHNSMRFVLGVKGDITDNWRYDTSLTYGATSSEDTYVNDFFAPNIRAALDVKLDSEGNMQCANEVAHKDGCVPYTLFSNNVTKEQADYLTATGILSGLTEETVFNGFVSGDLPLTLADDPVQAVFGLEYRKEHYRRTSDNLFENGQLLGNGGAVRSVDGSYDVKELFSELYVPMVQNKEFIQDLVLELGLRVSDYSTTGTVATYKAGLNWQVNDSIKFRGSYNRASRAPNVVELYSPQRLALWDGTDPCAGATPIFTAAQCANTGVTAAQYGNISVSSAGQYNEIIGGNPDLDKETGDTFTIGFVATPLEGLTLNVDYWNIKISGLIDGVSSQLALDKCGETGNAVFCDLVNRGPSGSLWRGTTAAITSTDQNLGYTKQSGIDFAGDYVMEMGEGSLNFKLLGSYLIDKFTQSFPGEADSEYDCVGRINGNCYPTPKWRHTASVIYNSGDFWQVGLKWRYFGKVTNPDSERDNKDISAYSYLDLSAGFELSDNVNLAMGINNILDRDPPMLNSSNSTTGNTKPGTYDPLGRRLFATITAQF